MKKSKIVTPVLLFLMIVLLLISIYYNFAFKTLQTKIEALSMENELIKNQRMEIELAMINEEAIRDDIEEIKLMLEQDEDFLLTDGGTLIDEINKNLQKMGLEADRILIGQPQLANDNRAGLKTLLVIPVEINFMSTYDNAKEFISCFEDSRNGAYKVKFLTAGSNLNGQYSWNMTLEFYYYGDSGEVTTKKEETREQDQSGIGEMLWIQ